MLNFKKENTYTKLYNHLNLYILLLYDVGFNGKYSSLFMNKDKTNQNPKMDKSVTKSDMTDLDLASSIINNSSDTIIATNLNGEITLWNNGAVKLYGYTREEVLGKNISIVYLEEDLPQLGQDIDKVIQGENVSNQERIIEK